ncbi:MAG: hypothetical protein CLLPBCKN_001365 [Chroococcidiopsis cubana SAG 39.79]|uniref:Uncharacterized protein n=1 Tax=Chroococcidiopsis cubana SAG 39.79 TaxID=388085 RepID=A0AB37U7J1_9CYAN|nr:hypothetical protein [Chroococcidiopsis cubana]MDZ4871977.1 hypothetical protein [Chroococcidiopsis cubana SAG 39.79]PSB56143.1 hypothetical protein C7B79_32550 [Chroococcidiopsis cubana CCALA 043]RUS94409.1 hypothetical protein DSM107010_71970 [Chroococcidiopsis cubana SAG 39.79]
MLIAVINSRWQTPLPTEENVTTPVDVYGYYGRWMLITRYRLGDAIVLARRAGALNLFVFPQDVDPRDGRL